MNDAEFVSRTERRSYHLHVFKCFLRRESTLVCDYGLEGYTFNILHYDVGYFFFEQSVVEDGDDVGMTDCGGGHRFLMKSLHKRGVVADKLGFDRLDGA